MGIPWLTKLETQLKVSFSILHGNVEAGLAGSPVPDHDHLLHAS